MKAIVVKILSAAALLASLLIISGCYVAPYPYYSPYYYPYYGYPYYNYPYYRPPPQGYQPPPNASQDQRQ